MAISTLSEYEQEQVLIDLIDELKSIKYTLDPYGFVATLPMFQIVYSVNHNCAQVLVSRNQLLPKALEHLSCDSSQNKRQWLYQVTTSNLQNIGLIKHDLAIGSCALRFYQVEMKILFMNGEYKGDNMV